MLLATGAGRVPPSLALPQNNTHILQSTPSFSRAALTLRRRDHPDEIWFRMKQVPLSPVFDPLLGPAHPAKIRRVSLASVAIVAASWCLLPCMSALEVRCKGLCAARFLRAEIRHCGSLTHAASAVTAVARLVADRLVFCERATRVMVSFLSRRLTHFARCQRAVARISLLCQRTFAVFVAAAAAGVRTPQGPKAAWVGSASRRRTEQPHRRQLLHPAALDSGAGDANAFCRAPLCACQMNNPARTAPLAARVTLQLSDSRPYCRPLHRGARVPQVCFCPRRHYSCHLFTHAHLPPSLQLLHRRASSDTLLHSLF